MQPSHLCLGVWLCVCVIPLALSKRTVCFSTLHDKIGTFQVTPKTFKHSYCVWHIKAEPSVSISILLRRIDTLASGTQELLYVAIYDSAERFLASARKTENLKQPLVWWRGQPDEIIQTFHGTELWLVIHRDVTSPITNQSRIRFDYVFNSKSYSPSCDISNGVLPHSSVAVPHSSVAVPHHATHTRTSAALGATAELACPAGYVITRGQGKARCSVSNGRLQWVSDGSVCESMCLHPPRIPHAKLNHITQKTANTRSLYKSRIQIPSSPEDNETTIYSSAQYMCEEPYTQSGEITLHCQPDTNSKPTWSSTNHTCTIPDCSRKYILTKQSGTLVHPSLQQQRGTSGSVTCAWEIQATGNSHITLHIRYIDLPNCSHTNLAVFGTGRARPSRLFAATGNVERVTVTSETPRVNVVYQGVKDLQGHRGFYIEYTTSHSRWARDVNDVDTDDDVISADTPIDTAIPLQVKSLKGDCGGPDWVTPSMEVTPKTKHKIAYCYDKFCLSVELQILLYILYSTT